MNTEAIKKVRIEHQALSGFSAMLHRGLLVLFLTLFVLVWLRLFFLQQLFPETSWPEGLLLLLALTTLLVSLVRQVPLQNVIRVTVILGVLGAIFSEVAARTGIPFGPFDYTNRIGPRLFDKIPWAVPAIWIVFILSSRGVAQLAFRRWRGNEHYGLWIMGVTAGFTAWLGFGLEPFATTAISYWRWHSSQNTRGWYSAPWFIYASWMVASLVILAFATPSLINKKPVDPPPPGFQPLFIWSLLNLLFATGCAVNHLTMAATIILLGSATGTIFAVRGVGACKTGSLQ